MTVAKAFNVVKTRHHTKWQLAFPAVVPSESGSVLSICLPYKTLFYCALPGQDSGTPFPLALQGMGHTMRHILFIDGGTSAL